MKKLAVGRPAVWLLASPALALEQGRGLSLEVPYTCTTNQGLVMIPTVT